MFKKSLSAKSIIVIAFVVPVLGVLSEWYNFRDGTVIGTVSAIISSVNLSWLNTRGRGFMIDGIFNYLFYALLLLGAILLASSKGRETRLIRFIFAVILFSKIVFIPFAFTSLFSNRYPEGLAKYAYFVLYLAARFAWVWLSWQVLAYFNSQKEPEVNTYTYAEHTASTYVNATLGQRFMNIMIDSIVMILIYSMLFNLIIWADLENNILMRMQDVTGDKFALIIVIVFCRSLYYVAFETILGATPAKYLTETRVVNEEGEKPGFGQIMGRTLSRFIPFEVFSFVFGITGWHDRVSNTSVIKDKRTGVTGGWYVAIIPASLVLWTFSYWAIAAYGQYAQHQKYRAGQDSHRDEMYTKLAAINANDFVELKQVDSYSYYTTGYFLKVEKVTPDSIRFLYMDVHQSQNQSQLMLEKMYNDLKETLPHVSFSRKQLRDAIEAGTSPDTQAKQLNIFDKKYAVGSIDQYFQTNIKLSGSGGYGDNYINIGLENDGWPADLTNIKAEDGDITFSTTIPQHLPVSSRNYNSYPFQINGTIKDGSDFKIDFTVRDTTGREQVYQVQGNCKNAERVLVRLR